MFYCQELKNQLDDVDLTNDLSGVKAALERYKNTGSTDARGKLEEKGREIAKLKKLDENLQKVLNKLISEHPQADEFTGKLQVNGGEVVCEDSIDLRDQKQVYLPACISKVEGSLWLHNLESAEGLEFPEKIGDLLLNSLKSSEGLNLPKIVRGNLDLRNLESAEGLDLPNRVGRYLDLRGLESAEGLDLPDKVVDGAIGGIYLDNLSKEQREKVKQKRPDLADEIK